MSNRKKKTKITTKKNRTTLPSKTVAVAVHSSCAWCVVCGARMHGVLVRGATSLVRGVGVFVALEFVVIVVALEFLWCRWSHWSLRVVVHACAANPHFLLTTLLVSIILHMASWKRRVVPT